MKDGDAGEERDVLSLSLSRCRCSCHVTGPEDIVNVTLERFADLVLRERPWSPSRPLHPPTLFGHQYVLHLIFLERRSHRMERQILTRFRPIDHGQGPRFHPDPGRRCRFRGKGHQGPSYHHCHLRQDQGSG